jgi:hypothetical protein
MNSMNFKFDLFSLSFVPWRLLVLLFSLFIAVAMFLLPRTEPFDYVSLFKLCLLSVLLPFHGHVYLQQPSN